MQVTLFSYALTDCSPVPKLREIMSAEGLCALCVNMIITIDLD